MILVDSSVWIDYFRGVASAQADQLDALLASEPLLIGDLILAYFGDRDRSFRRIVTVAQRVVSRGRIVMQSVTMSR